MRNHDHQALVFDRRIGLRRDVAESQHGVDLLGKRCKEFALVCDLRPWFRQGQNLKEAARKRAVAGCHGDARKAPKANPRDGIVVDDFKTL